MNKSRIMQVDTVDTSGSSDLSDLTDLSDLSDVDLSTIDWGSADLSNLSSDILDALFETDPSALLDLDYD